MSPAITRLEGSVGWFGVADGVAGRLKNSGSRLSAVGSGNLASTRFSEAFGVERAVLGFRAVKRALKAVFSWLRCLFTGLEGGGVQYPMAPWTDVLGEGVCAWCVFH